MVSVRRQLLALAAALALLLPTGGVAAAQVDRSGLSATPLAPSGTIAPDITQAAKTKDGRVAVIVQLQDAAVADYTGTVKGLKATNPKSNGRNTIDFKSPATTAYRQYLKGKQDAFVQTLGAIPSASAHGRSDLALNAVSLFVKSDEIQVLAALPGVQTVMPDTIVQLDTDTSPTFIGAVDTWAQLGGQESAGQGVIVADLDTGIWPEHPSFSDPDPSGKPYAAPPAAPDGLARPCDFSSGSNPGPAATCNNKLIAAGRFMDTYVAVNKLQPGEFTSARDDDGHGTHTASTAAGNGQVHASIFGVDRGVVSGIAPRAYLMMYKICGAAGCYQSDSVNAIDAAIGDGANVINFSISGGANAYSDAVELAFLGAYDAGVFVAASAGNSGPTADTTDHRGPWVTTVAASTHTRAFVDTVHLTADGGATLVLQGTSLTAGVGPAPVVVAGGDGLCGPTPAGTYTGKIVICKRGTQGRAEKGLNVLNAGGVGMILYNQSAAVTDLETDNHYLPASHIQFSQGQTLLAFVAGHTNVQATITEGVKGTQQGDVMASFSSRGGPNQTLGVSKPDITAPGVQILAGASPQHIGVAGAQGELFQAIAGTSMSSPHIAGSGALLKALHPDWTPGQIKSAMMTTASTANLVKEDGTTRFNAFDAGSGRIDLTTADSPGLTFDVSTADYLAHPADLWNVNYPSVFSPQMPGLLTVQRTAHSVLGVSTTWALSVSSPADFQISVPKSIKVDAGGNATFAIGLNAMAVPIGATRFATVTLAQTKGGTRVLHMPVTIVRRQAPAVFNKTCSPTALTIFGTTSCSLTLQNPTFNAITYSISDQLPTSLKVVPGTVVNGTTKGQSVLASGSLPAAQPPDVSIGAGSSPVGGYLPLSLFGIAPISGVGDDTITNFTVPAFPYAGETWNRLGVSSNGILVVGGGTAADATPANQNLPNTTPPNNVLAGFWTDLNPSVNGGSVRIGILSGGGDSWIVVDWNNVQEFSTDTNKHNFEIWIGIAGDAHPGEDVTYAYGANAGTGDLGQATVGAENKFGNRGQNYFFNGTGTLPVDGTQLAVTTVPGSFASAVVSYDAQATDHVGPWTNCATLTSNAFQGVSTSCVSGTISNPGS